jgi:hypothetical protein
VRTGSTLSSRRCVAEPSPELAGKYVGTVHNNNSNLDAPFSIQLVRSSDDGVLGCMEVQMPLIGTGPVTGSSKERNILLNLNAPNLKITFTGTRVGHSIDGNYTVTTTGETGKFTLHQTLPRVDFTFNPSNCPQ